MKVIRGKTLSADKILIEAKGPKLHKGDRKRGVIPKGLRGVDVDSEWGKSGSKGWIQGYGLDILVNADRDEPLIPLSAYADKGNSVENKVFKEHFVYSLPSLTKYIPLDERYDDWGLIKAVEERRNGRYITRRVIIPMKKRHTKKERLPYIRYYQSPRGQELYRRRRVTIEPFFERLKRTFEMARAWMRGLANNRVLFVVAIWVMQLLTLFNYRHHLPLNNIQWIVDLI